MRYFVLLFILATSMHAQTIFNFYTDVPLSNWYIVNDGVMGGLSKGTITINKEGHGLFHGQILLENNGGFSSVRYRIPQTINTTGATQIVLTIKGDGKKYQFRIRDDYQKRYSYSTIFETSGDWQTIVINLEDMYPSFRGRKLDLPNFNASTLEEITFLIGNKKREEFALQIASIVMQ